MTYTPLLLSLFGTLALSAALMPIARLIARRLGIIARPQDDRWHREPVALLGGYAMAIAFAGGVILFVPAGPVAPVLTGAGLMFCLGALDDAWHFRASTKLVAQTAIAALMIYLSPALVITGMPVIDVLVTLTWVVGITNAFNLLDNIDGLSAGIAALAGGFYLAALAPGGMSPLSLAIGAFVGAALGFLIYNFRPASIFMGDSGSLFLGSFLGGTALLAEPQLHAGVVPVAAIPLLILLIPIFDTAFVTVTRRMAGRSPLVGGRDHLSHRLVAIGISERRAVVALYALAAGGGFISLALQHADFGDSAILVALYLIALAAIGLVLGHVEAHAAGAGARSAPLVSDVAYGNRIYEVLLDAALIAIAYYAAFRLRFQGPEFRHFLSYFAASFPLVIGSQIAGLAFAGKYRQMWRWFGAAELFGILRGIAIGVSASILLMLYIYRFEGFSRIVFAVDAVLLVFLIVGARAAISWMDEFLRSQRNRGRPVLIYGAGRAGSLLVREVLENRELDLRPIGFIDDDPAKRKIRLEGVPVVGALEDLPAILSDGRVTELLVSIRSLDRARLGAAASICRQHGVAIRSMRFALEEIGPVPHPRHARHAG